MPSRRNVAKGPRPTVRGWGIGVTGLLVLVVAAMTLRVDLLFIGLFLVLLPIAGMVSLAVDRPWLTVNRTFVPDAVAAGDEATTHLHVRNERSRPTPVLRWRDAAQTGLELPVDATLAPIGEHTMSARDRGDRVSLQYRIRTRNRGAYEVGPLLVERIDPFGLAHARYAIGTRKPLLVTPRVVDLQRGEHDASKSDGTERELLRHSIPSADELIAREYRTGDPLRRVHWRATARHDKLMVRQEEQRSNPQAWIFFDTGRSARPDHRHAHERNDMFEAGVDLVAALGADLLESGYLVGVIESTSPQLFGRAGSARSSSGVNTATYEQPSGQQQLLAALAGVRQQRVEQYDGASVLGAVLHRNAQSVPAFLVLVDGEQHHLGALGALRPFAEPAFAFLIGRARSGEEALTRAGWTCVPMDASMRPDEAWRAAIERRYSGTEHG
jgi:Uncharacterized conserved protein (some members contain a von Willebrand factor type A (vWA) domain)